MQLAGTIGGPLKVPGILTNGPNLFALYQRTSDHTANTQPALMPTALERSGDFSQTRDALGRPIQIIDPATGLPFEGGVIPRDRLSPQAAALLGYYPLPNLDAPGRYNYQRPIITGTRQDSVQTRLTQPGFGRNQVFGTFAYQRTMTDVASVFGFEDSTRVTGLDAAINWSHRFSQFFTAADPLSTQPPDDRGDAVFRESHERVGQRDDRRQRPGARELGSAETHLLERRRTARRCSVLVQPQPDARVERRDPLGARPTQCDVWRRCSLAAAHRSGAAGRAGSVYLHWVGDRFRSGRLSSRRSPRQLDCVRKCRTSTLRAPSYDGYVTDDWRFGPGLTLNTGIRWEYEAPITERFGRLVNLDVAPGFTSASAVVANNPVGQLTGPTVSRFADRSGQARLPAARRRCVASCRRIVARHSSRVRHLPQYVGLSVDCDDHGAAIAALEYAERRDERQPIRSRWPTGSSRLPVHRAPRPIPLRSIRTSASATPKTGRRRCSATCRHR